MVKQHTITRRYFYPLTVGGSGPAVSNEIISFGSGGFNIVSSPFFTGASLAF